MKNTCCFFGHRTINETEQLKSNITATVLKLIDEEKVDTFLFGRKSRFNDLCYEIITDIKQRYPNIKRVYIRAEYPHIKEDYENYLLKRYEDTYYPEKIIGAGKSVYIKRNYEMIEKSCFCIVYYNEAYMPTIRKSGTEIALQYAKKLKKNIFVFE